MDARGIAEKLLGAIEWTGADIGFCQCPGIEAHTHPNKPKDCLVMLDKVPTVYCVHTSCRTEVAEKNKALRTAILGGNESSKGTLSKPREATPEEVERRKLARERHELEERSRRAVQRIIAENRVAAEELFESSPVRLVDDPRGDWRLHLGLFNPDAVVWIGSPMDSCNDDAAEQRKAYCRRHFRTVTEWLKEHSAPGQFTCGSMFKAGIHSRSNANVVARPFLVVESDTLGKAEMTAIFAWMRRFMRLRAILDTAGKSLHGWFDYPSEAQLAELRVILPALGCDEALFKASQPCRLAGAERDGKIQRLLWLDLEGRK